MVYISDTVRGRAALKPQGTYTKQQKGKGAASLGTCLIVSNCRDFHSFPTRAVQIFLWSIQRDERFLLLIDQRNLQILFVSTNSLTFRLLHMQNNFASICRPRHSYGIVLKVTSLGLVDVGCCDVVRCHTAPCAPHRGQEPC